MFKKLAEFSYKRTKKEAVGFYIAYLLIFMLAAGLIGMVFGGDSSDPFASSIEIGAKFAVIASTLLSFAIIHSKKLLNNFGYIILGLVSGFLAYLGGGLLGLIITAYLTTKDIKRTTIENSVPTT